MGEFGRFAGNMLGFLAVVGVVLLVIFLVFREFFCWYWKINERVALLTEIRNQLAAQRSSQNTVTPAVNQSVAAHSETAPGVVVEGPKGRCPNCESTIPLDSVECPKCKAQFRPHYPSSGFKIQPLPFGSSSPTPSPPPK